MYGAVLSPFNQLGFLVSERPAFFPLPIKGLNDLLRYDEWKPFFFFPFFSSFDDWDGEEAVASPSSIDVVSVYRRSTCPAASFPPPSLRPFDKKSGLLLRFFSRCPFHVKDFP